jgi:hypothetical protein
MSEFANVESVAAIARFRVALIQFEEEATNTLDQLERQAQKFLHWLEADTATYWRLEVLRCHEKISRARSALDTALMRKTKDFRPACIEEKDNLRFAKDRLAMAEEKTEKVRRWARVVREEFEEYRGQLNRLRDGLGVQIPRGVSVLDRTLRALEKYTELAPPPAETLPPLGGGDQSGDLDAARIFRDEEETLSPPPSDEDPVVAEGPSRWQAPAADEPIFPEADDRDAAVELKRSAGGEHSDAAWDENVADAASAEAKSSDAETDATEDSESVDSDEGDGA